MCEWFCGGDAVAALANAAFIASVGRNTTRCDPLSLATRPRLRARCAQRELKCLYVRRARLVERMCTEEKKTDEDVVERVWRFFFGAKEATPFGLARFDRDRFPELYPAELEERAELLPEDAGHPDLQLLRPLLRRTSLETRPLQLLFDADRDGWTATAFHSAVDKKGPALVLARSTGGAVFGGYSPKGWVGYGESRGSVAAFLFTWPQGVAEATADSADGGASTISTSTSTSTTTSSSSEEKPFYKLRKVGKAAMAVMDVPESGPQFGADSLIIPLMDARQSVPDGSERRARCNLGPYYERLPNGGKSLFAPGENRNATELTQLRVYGGVYADDEEIPFSDALPFALE